MSRIAHPALLLALAAPALLAGCADPGPQFAPACPSLALLHDADDLSRYAAGGRDLRDLTLQARIVAVPASCTWADQRQKVRATVQVNFDLTRGPAATGRRVQVPYFVAVAEGDRILDEQDYMLGALFPPNVDHAPFAGGKIDLLLPITREKSAAAYQIYVGFRLSPAELATNRRQSGG